MHRWQMIIVAILLYSCGAAFLKRGAKSVRRDVSGAAEVASVSDGKGGQKGTIKADATVPQKLVAAPDSVIAGTVAEFPPGALAIDTEVAVTPATGIDTQTLATDLDLPAEKITQKGQAVEISTAIPTDANQPFTLAIPLPDTAGLVQVDYSRLVVLYRIKKVGDEAEVVGLKPRDELVVRDGQAVFEIRFFGTFQAVMTEQVIAEAKEVDVGKAPVVPVFVVPHTGFTALEGQASGVAEGRLKGTTSLLAPYSVKDVASGGGLIHGFKRDIRPAQ